MNTAILFTNNNLRLRDNLTLEKAIETWDELTCVFFLNKKSSLKEVWWMKKTGAYRTKFLIESIKNLEENLKKLWWKLHVIHGESTSDLQKFFHKNFIHEVFVQKPIGSEELEELKCLEDELGKKSILLNYVQDGTMIDPDDLPFHLDDFPQVYTHFRRAVENTCNMNEKFGLVKAIKFSKLKNIEHESLELNLEFFGFSEEDALVDSRAAIHFIGWEDEAWNRVSDYFWNSNNLSRYKKTRNGMVWSEYSSKFSAWLAQWNISARSLYSEVKKYETEVMKNDSTYWLIFELLWRDFFQFVFMADNTKFFHNFPNDEMKLNKTDAWKFKSWQKGTLGVPFVDANMIELKKTGYMSNRGRQNVASYLIKDLGVDWRWWAMHFENLLVDYDLASNWWNWAYQAWVGNDPRDNRYFNIEKQQSLYDPDEKFRKLWLQ